MPGRVNCHFLMVKSHRCPLGFELSAAYWTGHRLRSAELGGTGRIFHRWPGASGFLFDRSSFRFLFELRLQFPESLLVSVRTQVIRPVTSVATGSADITLSSGLVVC